MKKFVAMYVDVGDGSDNRPRVLGVYDTKEEAVSEIIKDMYGWVDGMNPNGNCETEVNECRMMQVLVTTIAIGILKKSRCKEGNMSKKSNIKEDKDWTVADMVEYVITGKKPKV